MRRRSAAAPELDAARPKVLARFAGHAALPERMPYFHPELYLGNEDESGLPAKRAGKSTLLHALLRRVTLEEWVAYFPQEVPDDEVRALLVELRALPTAERGRVLSIVARLESPPARVLDGEELSPGEVRKLMIARSLLSSPASSSWTNRRTIWIYARSRPCRTCCVIAPALSCSCRTTSSSSTRSWTSAGCSRSSRRKGRLGWAILTCALSDRKERFSCRFFARIRHVD